MAGIVTTSSDGYFVTVKGKKNRIVYSLGYIVTVTKT